MIFRKNMSIPYDLKTAFYKNKYQVGLWSFILFVIVITTLHN